MLLLGQPLTIICLQSSSKPVNFYYLPSAIQETKQPIKAEPEFAAPLPAPPVTASPQLNQSFPMPKQLQKRGREVRQVQDEPSSGNFSFHLSDNVKMKGKKLELLPFHQILGLKAWMGISIICCLLQVRWMSLQRSQRLNSEPEEVRSLSFSNKELRDKP